MFSSAACTPQAYTAYTGSALYRLCILYTHLLYTMGQSKPTVQVHYSITPFRRKKRTASSIACKLVVVLYLPLYPRWCDEGFLRVIAET
jgi:hypothetical protein